MNDERKRKRELHTMRRSPIVLTMTALMLAGSDAPAQTRDAHAEALITRWIEAAGGARLWDNVRDVQYTITTVWFDSTGKETRRRPR